MTWMDPDFQNRRSKGVAIGQKTLSQAEYDALLLLLPYAGRQPLTDTNIELIVDTKGNILYGKEV